MKKQKGLSLTGLIVAAFVVVLGAIAAFKFVPVYTEYQTIKRIFRGMAEDPSLRKATRAQFIQAWVARTMVDDVKSVNGDDIEFTRDGDQVVISTDYSVKVHLFANVNACIDFHPTSQ